MDATEQGGGTDVPWTRNPVSDEMQQGPLRVLLVEDNDADAILLTEGLKRSGRVGFEVTRVGRLSDACERLRRDDFDAVLLDLSLPDSVGLETVHRARTEAPGVPMLVLTGAEDEKSGLEAVRLGMQDYLVKGQADGRVVARAVRHAMERKRGEDALREAHDELERRVQERTAELQRVNRSLRIVCESNQVLARASSEASLVQAVSRLMVEVGGYVSSWVVPAEGDRRSASDVAPSRGAGYDLADRAILRGEACVSAQPPVFGEGAWHATVACPLMASGVTLGALVVEVPSGVGPCEGHMALIQEVADDVAFGIVSLRAREERDRAQVVLERRAKQLRALAIDLTRTEQRERRRLGEVVHDHLQQLLVGARFQIRGLRSRIRDGALEEKLDQVEATLDEALRTARTLTIELSPPAFHEKGLAAGLVWLKRYVEEKHGLVVQLETDEEVEPATDEVRLFVFDVVRELLLNISKHAGVQRAFVRLSRSGTNLILTVSDAGVGIDVARLSAGADTSGGFGLFSARERLGHLGGSMEVESAPGKGARFTLLVPTV